ncbi:MAG: class A beta-lactamase-related serine hydrolase [Chloroflexi bacterium]|nr:class A beta-lactamase-related serine hydrolase [Chloroflexota bacterium]MDA1240681.1 class A beta-lactamase-related serine hydrolase [Chloroflexota bacterium]
MSRPRLPLPARLLALVVAWPLLLAPAGASAASLEGVCARVEEVASASAEVSVGFVLIDLETGEQCSLQADREFRMASLYKTLVLAELYRQVDAGLVALNDELIMPAPYVDDPVEVRLAGPVATTVGVAANRMIVFSDNTSALALREHLGVALVAETPEWLAMPGTEILSRFVSTPADQAKLYRQIYTGEVVGADASRAMYLTLAQQEIEDMIPAGLPAGTPIAHKTGTLDTWLHDVGIVRAPGGDFVLVVMTEHEDFNAALTMIRDVASAAFEPFALAAPPLLPVETAALAGRPVDLTASELASLQPVEATPIVIRPASDGTVFDASLPRAGFALTMPALISLVVMLAAAALVVPTWLSRRRQPLPQAVRYGASPMQEVGRVEVRATADVPGADTRVRASVPERGAVMRFGSRREDEERPNPVAPAERVRGRRRVEPDGAGAPHPGRRHGPRSAQRRTLR